MDKSRLANAFSKSCFMINIIFCKDDGYPLDDTKILQFILLEFPNEIKESVNKLLQKKTAALNNSFIKTRKATIILNHSIVMGLLYTSFEIYEFCVLLTFVASANLMYPIVNQQIETQDLMSSLKKLISFKHQIMAPLNPKEALNGDMAINRHDQRIQFHNAICLKTSNITRKFVMDKGQRSCFLVREELCAYYLLQNFFQFKSLKKVGKALAKNLEKFFGSNSVTLSQIIAFNKATNLFTLETPDLKTFNLDTSCYVALHCILNCLKELPIQFFILSIESKVKKFLLSNIQAKEGEKTNKNQWNNPSGSMLLYNTNDQTDNLKQLKLFLFFRLFYLMLKKERRY